MPIINYRSPLPAVQEALTFTEHKIKDVARMAKFLYGTPQGANFIVEQTGLQLMNPQLESNGKKFFDINSSNSTRLYNLGANLLSQITVQGSGIHLDRHGMSPVMDEQNKYYQVVARNDAAGTSRMLQLYKRLIVPTQSQVLDSEGRLKLMNDQSTILSYQGGANSIFGIGETKFTRVFNTTQPQTLYREDRYEDGVVHINGDYSKNLTVNYYDQLNLSTKLFSREQLLEITGIDPDRPTKPITPPPAITNVIRKPLFRALPDNLTNQIEPGQYVKPSGDTLLKDSGITYIDKRVNFETANGDQYVDGLNLINIYSSDDRAKDPESYDKYERDLVKLKFEIINNDNPNKTDHLVFRSFLHPIENQISQNLTEVNYLGRGDTFYVYNGYKETYSLGFDIMAASAGEMKPIWSKVNYLKSSLAPDYKGTKMRGSLVRLTIGNVLNRVPGIINQLNISVPEDAPWDVDIPATDSGDFAKELPRYLKLTFTFIPIYNHLVKRGKSVPFFSVDKLGYLEP